MHSNDIAKSFYDQGRADKWLSAKQTSWLYQQACRESGQKLSTHGTPTASGTFALESGELIGWSISVSPINGCARFQTHSVTAIAEQVSAERESRLETCKLFCQRVKEIPSMIDFYPPETIARMYKVSLSQVNEWLQGEKL